MPSRATGLIGLIEAFKDMREIGLADAFSEVLDADGNEVKSTKGIWVDPKTRKEHSGTFTVEATYDDHGNWTTLQSWFTPDDGGDRILTKSIKQTITYR